WASLTGPVRGAGGGSIVWSAAGRRRGVGCCDDVDGPRQHSSGGLERDAIAQRLEPTYEALLGDSSSDVVEVGSTEVAVLSVATEHFVGGDENAVGNGHRGPPFASTRFESPETLLEVAALLAR